MHDRISLAFRISLAAAAACFGLAQARAQVAPLPATAIPVAAPGQAPAGSVGGMGDVNLYPKRVVMSDRERTASIGL